MFNIKREEVKRGWRNYKYYSPDIVRVIKQGVRHGRGVYSA
jgi:hypothetical protein